MANLHRIEAIGNIVRTPEMRVLTNGQSVLSVTVAVDDTYEKDGEKHGQTYFWNLGFFGAIAEKVAARDYQKGDSLWFEGSPDINTYEARDGTIKVRTNVRFPRCFKVSRGRNGNNGNYHAAEPDLDTTAPAPKVNKVAPLNLDEEDDKEIAF